MEKKRIVELGEEYKKDLNKYIPIWILLCFIITKTNTLQI